MTAHDDGRALLHDLRARGIEVRVDAHGRIILRGDGPRLTDEDRARIQAACSDIVAILAGDPPCPTCGATQHELAAVRARRAMEEAWQTWDSHVRSCTDGCMPARSARCEEGKRLADAYFECWTRWLSAVSVS